MLRHRCHSIVATSDLRENRRRTGRGGREQRSITRHEVIDHAGVKQIRVILDINGNAGRLLGQREEKVELRDTALWRKQMRGQPRQFELYCAWLERKHDLE